MKTITISGDCGFHCPLFLEGECDEQSEMIEYFEESRPGVLFIFIEDEI